MNQMIQNAAAQSQIAKAMMETKVKISVAKEFKRNTREVLDEVLGLCDVFEFARTAEYEVPKGKGTITGPSVRLAEALAQICGNIDFGARVLRTDDESTEVQAFCFDKEKNVVVEDTIVVRHMRREHGGNVKLTDPARIAEHVNAWKSRNVRNCIFRVVPRFLADAAIERCRQTLEGEAKRPERIKRMVELFAKVNVSQELIERRLGHSIESIRGSEFADLWAIYNGIKDAKESVDTYFGDRDPTEDAIEPEVVQGDQVSELRNQYRGK